MSGKRQTTKQRELEALQLELDEAKHLAVQLRARARQQAAIAELGQRALVGANLTNLMNEAVTLITQTLQVEFVAVLEYQPNKESLLLRAGWGWQQTNGSDHTIIKADSHSQAGYTLLRGAPVVVENLVEERRFFPTFAVQRPFAVQKPFLPRNHQIVSSASVIIQGRNDIFGVLEICTIDRRVFTEDDIHFLQAVANILAAATDRKQAEAQLIQRNRELLSLQSASATITSSLDLQYVLNAVTGEMANLLNLEACTIFDWDQSDDLISVLAEHRSDSWRGTKSPTTRVYTFEQFPLIARVLDQQLVLQMRISQPGLDSTALFLFQEQQIKSLLIFPISFQGQVTGLVQIMDSQVERVFTEQEIAMAKLLANQAASAIENARLLAETRRILKEQLALQEAVTVISSTLDLNIVLNHIAEQIGQVVNATSVHIYDYNPETMTAVARALIVGPHACEQEELSDINTTYYLDRDFPGLIEFLESGQPNITYADNPDLTESELVYLHRFGTKAMLTIPMQIRGRVIAYAELRESRLKRQFTPEELILCQNIAQQAAIAMENARLHAETKRRAQHLSVLHELDRAITASLRISDVYHAFAGHATRLLAYDHMSIMLVEEEALCVTYVAENETETTFPTDLRLPRQTSAAGWVVAHRQPLLRHNIAVDTRFAEDKALVAHDIQTYMTIPVRIKGKIIGVWNIGSRQIGAYSPDELEIAQTMADQLAIAIENARLFEQARQEINERKRAEAALEKERSLLAQRVAERTAELSAANMELARASRLKDEFLASMSHELRTPLTAVLGLCDILRMEAYGPLTERQHTFVGNIEESGRHLLLLINDILDLSKIEAGKLELEISPISIQMLCHTSLQFIKQTAHKKQIKISLTIDNSTSTINADERRLKQVLINLLSNAVKFTPEEGKIGLEVVGDTSRNMIHFIVWDTGIGIAQEDISRLFQPFVQLDSRLSRQYSGTGLGLALVQRMVRMHGGMVSVASEVGQGSRFTVSLPWIPQTQVTAPATILTEQSSLKTDPYLAELANVSTVQPNRAPLILIAEDEPMLITILTDFLEAKGYRINVARNGVDALEKAKEKPPDMILMDVQMPEMDGLEVTRRLRQDPELATTPIIALTALAMPGDREQCLEAGANEYMSKPIKLTRLAKLIESYLDQSPGQKEGLL